MSPLKYMCLITKSGHIRSTYISLWPPSCGWWNLFNPIFKNQRWDAKVIRGQVKILFFPLNRHKGPLNCVNHWPHDDVSSTRSNLIVTRATLMSVLVYIPCVTNHSNIGVWLRTESDHIRPPINLWAMSSICYACPQGRSHCSIEIQNLEEVKVKILMLSLYLSLPKSCMSHRPFPIVLTIDPRIISFDILST